jgi:hypothetical protein
LDSFYPFCFTAAAADEDLEWKPLTALAANIHGDPVFGYHNS